MKRLTTDAGPIEYFWSLADKNGPLPEKSTGIKSRCWLWIGSIRQDGYGRFKFEGHIYSPTRLAWKLKPGMILDRLPFPPTVRIRPASGTCFREPVVLWG
jgi:hypothetical protein